MNTSEFYSNALNLTSLVSGGVDPRTGLYVLSLSLGYVQSEGLNGPVFPVRLQFNPLNKADFGFGAGWSMVLSSYDLVSRVLSLSNGESLLATQTPTELVLAEDTLKAVKVSRVKDGCDVVSREGQREELRVVSSGSIAVPERIVAANGTSITMLYSMINSRPALREVRDGQRVLLSVQRSSAGVRIVHCPATAHESVYTLVLRDAVVNRLVLPTAEMCHIEYGTFSGQRHITQVVTPLGARERISYKENGHKFPPGGPSQFMPHAVSHVVDPGHGQPVVAKHYTFSDRNYLGFGGGIRWAAQTDNLYNVVGEYSYGSTEYSVVDDALQPSVARVYNKFHLSQSEVRVAGTAVISQLTQYYADPGKPIGRQPPQFRLPQKTTIRYQDMASGQQRDDVTLTEFDVYGNLVKQVDPNGVVTRHEYYPAEGSSGCPADPLGFVRFLKQTTVMPAPAGAAGGTPTAVTRYQYALQSGVNGSKMTTVALIREAVHEVLSGVESLQLETEVEYIDQPAISALHGRVSKQTLKRNGHTTVELQAYDVTNEVLTAETLFIGFDGQKRHSAERFSVLTGLRLSVETEDQAPLFFTYDALGRGLTEVVASGTAFSSERTAAYQLANDKGRQATMLTTDTNGGKQRVSYDGLGRVVRVEELDVDAQSSPTNAAFREVHAVLHNSLGQIVQETQTDWLAGRALPLKNIFIYDDWGLLKAKHHQDGRKEYRETDLFARKEATWLEGAGKTVVHFDAFEKPLSVEQFDRKSVSQGKSTYVYDGLGRTVSKTDPVGNTTAYQYDFFGRLIRSTLPDGNAVDTEYAAHSTGVLPSVVKIAKVSLGRQAFDGLGRLSESVVGGRTTRWTYKNGLNQPASSIDPQGQAVEFAYERALGGAMVKRSAPGCVASYAFDAKSGQVKHAAENGYGLSCEYYPSGRLKAEERTIGGFKRKASYTYSLGGRPLTCSDVLGKTHETRYDALGRPLSFEQDALKAEFTHNALGQMVSITTLDKASQRSLKTTLSYDDLGREISRTFTGTSGPAQVLESSYTKAGKLASKTLRSGIDLLRGESFTYDKRGRLAVYTCAGSMRPQDPYGKLIVGQTYSYDALDNIVRLRTEFDGGSNVADYTYSSADPTQLTGVRHSHVDYPAPVTLAYDPNGQMIRDEQGRQLGYDALGRLSQVADSSGHLIRGYHYDAGDQLVELSQKGSTPTQRYYHLGKVINEIRENEQKTCLNSFGLSLGMQQKGIQPSVQVFGTDQQQSVISEMSGVQQRGVAYSPYGHRPAEGGLFSLTGFNGEQLDPLTGLYLLGNGYRAYSPTLMRFLSPDSLSPFGAGGLNPYVYCLGDPINRVDPTGHFSWQSILGIVLAVVGIAASIATFGAATPLAVIGLTLGVASGVVGIAGIVVSEVAPESDVGGILGWVSLGLGAASAAAGLAGAAAKAGQKINKAFSKGLSPTKGPSVKAMGTKPPKASGAGSSPATSDPKLDALMADEALSRGKGPWKLRLGDPKDIKPGLGQANIDRYDEFKNAIHNEGLDSISAAKKSGEGSKLSRFKGTSKNLNQFEIRIGGGERVSFEVVSPRTYVSPSTRVSFTRSGYIQILEVGGHS